FFETITGLLLMLWYTPSPDLAYGNMLDILGNVPLGQFTRDLHRLGAEGMVLIVSLHMMRTWVTGSYKKPRQFTWFSGLLLLVFTGLLSFTGYLLPWDQLALWAVTIGASMAEATPVIGEQVNLIVRGAPELGANGLLRFYLAHVLLLPALLFVFTGVHYYKVIIHGHSLPPQLENIGEDTAKRVPLNKRVYFIPDVLTNEMMWIGLTTLIFCVLCVWFYHAPLENHADPQVTPLGTTAPWYFLWIQGALKLGDKFFWGIAFPTIALGALATMPYVDVAKSRRYAHRRISLSIAMGLISITTVLSYMGLPEFAVATSAEIEILHELTKEPAHNHVGKMRTVPFDQAIAGMYTTAQLHPAEGLTTREAVDAFTDEYAENTLYSAEAGDYVTYYDFLSTELVSGDHLNVDVMPGTFRAVPENAPVLLETLELLDHEIELRSEELPGAYGIIVITDDQQGLKRVDMAIVWDGVLIESGEILKDAEGEPLELIVTDNDGNEVREVRIDAEHIYLHENAAYFD
ncbi:MAG: cytochrome b, partial [Aggregatilineales bacterium]